MRLKAVNKLVEDARSEASLDSDKSDEILKELVLGAFQNLARIADALDKPKP